MYVNFNILNQLGSPSLNSNTFANRPAAGQTGRLFISTNTFEIYRDNGTGWDLIGTGTGGGITGSGTANQVTYWTGTSAVGGESAFTYNPTTNALRVDGNISLNRNADAWTPNNVFTVGNGSFTSDVGGTYLTFNAYYNVDWKYSQNGVASFYAQANGGHIWYNASSGTAGNNLNSVIAMYLDDKENLGVATAPPNWYTDYNATIINTANVYGQKSTTVGGITSNAFLDNTALSWRYQITGLAARMEIASGAVNWFTAPSGTLNTDITFTRRLRLTNTGQMNFNTADTLWGSGARVIHLSDRMSMYSITSGTAAAIYSNNAYFDGTQTRRIIGSTAGQFVSDSNTFYWENAAASTADSLISWTRIATMTASANVLIGTTTDSGERLQVSGTCRIANTTGTPFSIVQNQDALVNFVNITNTDQGSSAGSFITWNLAFSQIARVGFSRGPSNVIANPAAVSGDFMVVPVTGFAFQTTSASGEFKVRLNSTSTQFTIKNNGNTLINTSTDSGFKFDVSGSTRLNGTFRVDGQTAATAGGASGQHLIINCDGTTYKIALLNN